MNTSVGSNGPVVLGLAWDVVPLLLNIEDALLDVASSAPISTSAHSGGVVDTGQG